MDTTNTTGGLWHVVGFAGSLRAGSYNRALLAAAAELAPTMLRPEVRVARAHERFDAEDRLNDETTRGFVKDFLGAFSDWIAHVAVRRQQRPFFTPAESTPAGGVVACRARSHRLPHRSSPAAPRPSSVRV